MCGWLKNSGLRETGDSANSSEGNGGSYLGTHSRATFTETASLGYKQKFVDSQQEAILAEREKSAKA